MTKRKTELKKELKKIHKLGNKITNFENPDIQKIIDDGWKPIIKKGKIIDWE